jgi:hypothetical protein
VSLLTGKVLSHRANITASKSYNTHTDFRFDMKTFTELRNAQSVTDVIKFDAGLKRIYAACFSGAISVFQMDDPDHYRKLEDFPVQKKVHSLAVDPDTHRVYAPEQEADGKGVARMVVYDAVVHP